MLENNNNWGWNAADLLRSNNLKKLNSANAFDFQDLSATRPDGQEQVKIDMTRTKNPAKTNHGKTDKPLQFDFNY